MREFWLRAIGPILLNATFALLLYGLFTIRVGLVWMIGALLWLLGRYAWQLFKLERWLRDARLENVPEGQGLWEETYSRLYEMMQQHQRTKQELAAQVKYIEQATAALPEGVAILNAAQRIEWCNPLAEAHFGLNMRQDTLQDITYLVRQPEFIDYLQAGHFDQPLVLRPNRNDDQVLSIKLVRYGDNKRLLISRDITQLERIETMRRDFVANVSHELRTPLTVVGGFVENLLDMEHLDPEQTQHALRLVAEQTRRMGHLVADLLTLSRLENEQTPLNESEVDMEALVQEVYRDGHLLSGGRHTLNLQYGGMLRLRGCREELRSAFGNLVSNAVRYTPEGGEITLHWEMRADTPLFTVSDNGIGIAASDIPRLTERFYRVEHSRSRETGGTGLGLAIVQRIALRHQAKLEILSEEGRGSAFSLRFPAHRVLASTPTRALAQS